MSSVGSAADLPALLGARPGSDRPPLTSAVPVLDFGTVRRLRHVVAEALALRLQAQPVRDPAAQRELGRALAAQAVADWADEKARNGSAVSTEHELALVEAVFAALFGLGRLQPLVDDPSGGEHRGQRRRPGVGLLRRRPGGTRSRRSRTPTRS